MFSNTENNYLFLNISLPSVVIKINKNEIKNYFSLFIISNYSRNETSVLWLKTKRISIIISDHSIGLHFNSVQQFIGKALNLFKRKLFNELGIGFKTNSIQYLIHSSKKKINCIQ